MNGAIATDLGVGFCADDPAVRVEARVAEHVVDVDGGAEVDPEIPELHVPGLQDAELLEGEGLENAEGREEHLDADE